MAVFTWTVEGYIDEDSIAIDMPDERQEYDTYDEAENLCREMVLSKEYKLVTFSVCIVMRKWEAE